MTIQVGLVGFGLSGSVFHAPLIESVQGLSLTAVVSSDPEKVHKNYPGIIVVPTLDLLLENKAITLVVIATPNDTHYKFAQQAIEAGKHVVVDKPFVVHSEQANELIALAQKQNVILSVYQNRRWDNDFLTIRQLMASEILGNLSTYEAHYDRFRPVVRDRWRERALPGSGTLYDLGSHLIDQALCLFGIPQTIWADVHTQRKGAQIDDYFHLILGYEQQAIILHSGSIVREAGPHFQLHGSKGSFIKYGFDSQEDALKAGKRPGDPEWGQDSEDAYGDLTMDVGELTIKGKVKTLPGHYEVFYQGIVDAILMGKRAPVSAEEAKSTIQVIEGALQSHREQRIISFDA